MHGIFDSGVGGLSVWREIKKAFPGTPLLYFADQAHMPYGDLPIELSYRYVEFAIEKMIALGATSISIACHTISTTHGEALKNRFDVPISDIASTSLLTVEKRDKITVLGTKGTIQSNYYQHRLGARLHFAAACPTLVPMIEKGEVQKKRIEKSLSMIPRGAEGVLLACTHYPFISEMISEILGGIETIDPAPTFAKNLSLSPLNGNDLFFTTGSPKIFYGQATTLLKINLSFPFFVKALQCHIKPALPV